eukprot:CAMPEP_0114248602 /NCGR_PEP_ID=MMETSP0058-20121206/13664_1 /TAXON_ID=36894 /ORGANISM="Pyramimonas parkeae, CCMP726" /LENGTH=272 /DNA_ID=CAMNT_0001362027 /DNA_START=51 /DNA_END=869 /DNA_ORIENTATION=-
MIITPTMMSRVGSHSRAGANLSMRRVMLADKNSIKSRVVRPKRANKAACASMTDEGKGSVDQWWLMGAAFTTFMAPAEEALAVGRENGILEGKTIALLHPTIMFFLFGATAWAGFLGWQHRRTRTIGEQISELKKTLPAADSEGNVPDSPVSAEIATLSASRKELVAGGFRDRHHNWGNLLLSLGVMTSVAGGMNTYIRVGKLFPGPHLYAGVGITVLWAMAAALVPYMQKGNTAARNAHIVLNTANLGLFAWQVPTGIDIVLKVFKFAAWP